MPIVERSKQTTAWLSPRGILHVLAAGAVLLAVALPAQMVVDLAPAEDKEVLTLEVATPPDYPPAQAFELESAEEIGSGVYVHGAIGDAVLQNALSRFVFGAAPEEGPFVNERGSPVLRRGALLDVMTDIKAPESFHMFLPVASAIGMKQFLVESLSVSPEDDGRASVTVDSRHEQMPFLRMRTSYLMQRDLPGLLVTTTITNTSDSERAPDIYPADAIWWGSMSAFVPGRGYINAMQFSLQRVEFVFGRFDDQWILVAPDSGTFDVRMQGEEMVLTYGDAVTMEPGETRLYRRWIMVGDQDPALLYSAVLAQRQDIDTGTLVGRVIEREQAPDRSLIEKAPVPDTDIFIAPLTRPNWDNETRSDRGNRPYLIARTNSLGQFQTLLPVGEYQAFPAPSARLAPRPQVAARIRKGAVEGLDFGTSGPSRLIYRLVDAETGQPVPGKLTIEPLRGTNEVHLGPFGNVRAGNTVLSSHGSGIVDLPPGNYRIIASRGPEYHITEKRVTVRSLQDVEETFQLRRAFETPGWISADIGVRTDATPTVRVTPKSRVVAGAAEGVDWLVTGDSGVATDLEGAVRELGLGRFIRTSPGYRRSGHETPFTGDFLLFPANICATGPNPDFSAIAGATSGNEVIEAMRAICPNGVILSSRATWPTAGYLTLQGYERERGRLPAGDYSMDFDAFQIWEGKRQALVANDYRTYHTVLRSGYRMAAFGNSNTHGTWMAETGYPRVYIRSSKDSPEELDPEELALNIKRGLVSVTNGPFIDVKVNGQPMGSLVTDTDGEVEVDLQIFAANWVPISAISINLNGQFVRRILLNPSMLDREAGRVFPAPDKPDEGKLKVRVEHDGILEVIVEGNIENPLDPVNPFNAFARDRGFPKGQFAYALSAPIFIDTDGNGKLDIETLPPLQPEEELEEFQDPPF